MQDGFFDLLQELVAVEERPVPPTTMEMAKETGIAQFIRRRKFAEEKVKKIDNSTLPAGSPVFTYCRHCGVPLEKLPEDYLFRPYSECSQCSGLANEGWLDEAIAAVRNA